MKDEFELIPGRHRFGRRAGDRELVPLQKLDWFAMAGLVALIFGSVAVVSGLVWLAARAGALLWELV